MTHFFEKKDPWGHGLAVWVLAAMVFILPLSWQALKGLHLENDVENWLPDDDDKAIALNWYRSHFDQEENLILTWPGSSIDDPRIKLFQQELEPIVDADGVPRGGSPYVSSINTPREALDRMLKQKVDEEEAIRRLTGTLIGRGPLRVRFTEAGRRRPSQTISELEAMALRELGIELRISEPFYESLPELSNEQYTRLEEIEAREDAARDPDDEPFDVVIEIPKHDVAVSWGGIDHTPEAVQKFEALALGLHSPVTEKLPQGEPLIEDCFFAVGTPVAVIVTLSDAGLEDKGSMLRAIRAAAARSGISDADLRIGGRTVANYQLNAEVAKAAWNRDYPIWQLHRRSPMFLSATVSVLLAFAMLRSLRLTLLVLASSYYTIFVTVSIVPVTGGSLNMVLVVMPSLLMVLTISAAIHLSNYWKHAVARDSATAVVEAVRTAAKPCALASFTTAIGLLSLASSPLAPVRDFGIYSAVGCIISLLVVLYGLPAMLQLWPRNSAQVTNLDSRPWHKLGHFLSHHATLTACLFIGVGIVCSAGLRYFHTETKAIRYFPDNSRVVQDYRAIEENLTGIVAFDCIIKFDAAARDRLTFLERMELVRQVENEMSRHPEVQGTISLAAFMPVAEIPAANAGFRQKGLFNRRSNEIESRIKEGEVGRASRRFISFAIPEGAEPVLNGKHQYAHSTPEDELWRITAQVSIMSDLNYETLTSDINGLTQSVLKMQPGTDHRVTGMTQIFLATQQAVLNSLIESFSYAFIVIAIVMMAVVKDVLSGLITMIPNILPVSVVFGLISWYGLPVDIGTMITASVALGIAVDGTLHLLTWFRNGLRDGLSRKDAVANALGHCGPAMWQTSLAIGVGMLMLYWAELLLVSRFGWLMSALIFSALLGDIILLPALLGGVLGKLIEKKVKRDLAATPTPPAESDADESSHPVREPHLQTFTQAPGQILRKDPGGTA